MHKNRITSFVYLERKRGPRPFYLWEMKKKKKGTAKQSCKKRM